MIFLELTIGAGSIIGCNAVIYTGSRIGNQVLIGDLASLREGCEIGDQVIIGRGVQALYECKIGNRSRIQDQVHLVGNLVVEEDVFIGMGVMTSNDNNVYLARFGLAGLDLHGPIIRRFAVIGTGAVLLPGVEIGTGAMVAAGAVVTTKCRTLDGCRWSPSAISQGYPLLIGANRLKSTQIQASA